MLIKKQNKNYKSRALKQPSYLKSLYYHYLFFVFRSVQYIRVVFATASQLSKSNRSTKWGRSSYVSSQTRRLQEKSLRYNLHHLVDSKLKCKHDFD